MDFSTIWDGFTSVWSWDPTGVSHPTIGQNNIIKESVSGIKWKQSLIDHKMMVMETGGVSGIEGGYDGLCTIYLPDGATNAEATNIKEQSHSSCTNKFFRQKIYQFVKF